MTTPTVTSQMLLYQVEPHEIAQEYPTMWAKVFQHYDPAHEPGMVYVGKVNHITVGFLACYRHDRYTVYIQYAGFYPEWRGAQSLGLLSKALAAIHIEYPHAFAVVENTNNEAIRLAT